MGKVFYEIIHFIRELYKEPNAFIPLHAPVFIGNEKKYLDECIDTTFVSSVGKFVDLFEEKMAEYTGAKKAVACVNGTSALHLALKLIGVKQDEEVITQPLTFIATANAIAYHNAYPVFLDVDMDNMGLSPEALETWLNESSELKFDKSLNKPICINKATGRRIAAIVPMHTYGHPCRIDEIIAVAHEYHIPVVEDAAESMGSTYKGKHTGTFGNIGILSFNGNKILTTGGGGMLLFNDAELAKFAKHLTIQAKIPHPWEFAHDQIGYNYRMPNINAALGLAQLEQLDNFIGNKRKTAKAYSDFFKNIDISFFHEPKYAHSNYWLNSILLNNNKERDDFIKYSNENKVMARPTWKLLNNLEMFKLYEKDNLRNAIDISNKLINLPSSVIK